MAVDDKPKIFTAEGAEKSREKKQEKALVFYFEIYFNDNSCFFRIFPLHFSAPSAVNSLNRFLRENP